MKVILIKDVKGKGKKGDLIEVSNGYGSNYLIKNKLGVEASKANIGKLNIEKEQKIKAHDNEYEAMKSIAEKIKKLNLDFFLKVGNNGNVFGKVSSKQIIEKINSELNIKLQKKVITLDHDLNSLGYHEIDLGLMEDIKFKIKIQIKGD